jgi:hypothetical protein
MLPSAKKNNKISANTIDFFDFCTHLAIIVITTVVDHIAVLGVNDGTHFDEWLTAFNSFIRKINKL